VVSKRLYEESRAACGSSALYASGNARLRREDITLNGLLSP
jgi:hypothetical protein